MGAEKTPDQISHNHHISIMIPLDLSKTLANRKKYIDEVSDISVGRGTNLNPIKLSNDNSASSKSSAAAFEPRSPTGYTGLTNQGATCYLNSLLQSLFMFPEFRKATFEFMPLNDEREGSNDRITESTDLARQLQLLFAYLQLSDRVSVSTLGLTQKGFGWSSSDSFVQQV